MEYKTNIYLIKCLTNLHVGSGDANYGIIDKQVQRDVVSELPTIHASGIKGAFRQQFEQFFSDSHANAIVDIFGSDNVPGKKNEIAQAGTHRFFNAQLLSLPVRSNKLPFFRAFSVETLEQFITDLTLFGPEKSEDLQKALIKGLQLLQKHRPQKGTPKILIQQNGVVLEDFYAQPLEVSALDAVNQLNVLEPLIGNNIAIFHHDDFKEICKDLPVIARNHLDNGQSVNLWYEEAVPRESLFYFFVASPATDMNFDMLLGSSSNKVQIGANASVGCGYCKISKM